MLTRAVYSVLINYKDGTEEVTTIKDEKLYEAILERFDERKIDRVCIINRDKEGNILSYEPFFDSRLHELVLSAKTTTLMHDGELVTGHIGYINTRKPYYTFNGVGRRFTIRPDLVDFNIN